MGNVTNLFDLTGKVAVVTGGSRGLGREMILAFAEQGADVVIASRKLDACEALAKEVTERFPDRQALAVASHVGRWEDCDALDRRHLRTLRQGRRAREQRRHVTAVRRRSSTVSEELYDKVLAVNLKGPFRLLALVGERMAEGDGGSIINVSSIASIRPTPTETAYAAAKAGLNALTVAFAHAYGPKVRVNCIMPGPFLTDISKAWDLDVFERTCPGHLSRSQRGGQPDEIVGAALYFASAASSFTTGAILTVDGGGGGTGK